ncbi:MAG: S-layer homology domain-containing protein [Solibacillus sp.]
MFKNNKMNRFISVMLIFVMIFSLISPVKAGAEEPQQILVEIDESVAGANAKIFASLVQAEGSYVESSFQTPRVPNLVLALVSYDKENYTFLGWSFNGAEPILTGIKTDMEGIKNDKSIGSNKNQTYLRTIPGPPKSGTLTDVGLTEVESELRLYMSKDLTLSHTITPIFKSNKSDEATYDVTIESTEGGVGNKVPVQGNDWDLHGLPENGSDFVGWKQGIEAEFVSSDNPYRITATADTTYIAVFKKIEIELLDNLRIGRTSSSNANLYSNINSAQFIEPLSPGQRGVVLIPYTVTGTMKTKSTASFKVYAGNDTTGEVIASSEGEISQILTSSKTGEASIVIDPMPDVEQLTIEAVLNNGNSVTKTYDINLNAQTTKSLTYMQTPNDKYMSNVRTEDAGPTILDMVSFIDENTGKLSVYAAAHGGVLELKGNSFEFMQGLNDLPSGDHEGLTGMVVGIGGTEDHLVAVVKDVTEAGSSFYSLYDYTTETKQWIRNESSVIDGYDKELTPDLDKRALVVTKDDIWTEKAHWDGQKWTPHQYYFTSFVKSVNGDIYASSSSIYGKEDSVGLYKYSNNEWNKIELDGIKSVDLSNVSVDGTVVFNANSKHYAMEQSGSLREFTHLENTFSTNEKLYANIDRNNELYIFQLARRYFDMGTSGADGHDMYVFDQQDNIWKYVKVEAFNAPNEYKIGTNEYLTKKVRPTTVQNIYNLAKNMSIYAGSGGAVYSDFEETTITFNSNGGSQVAPINAKINSAINAPATPTKADQYFGGWYSDEELTKAYSFDYMPAKNIELFAKWSDKPVDLTQAKATANQTIEAAYKKYNKRDYSDEGWSELTQAKDGGIATIDAITGTFDEITTAMNQTLEIMRAVALNPNVTVAVSMEKFTLGQGYIIEPTLVTIPRNTQASKVITDLIVEKYGAEPLPYEMTGQVAKDFYLAHVLDNGYQSDYHVPTYITNAILEDGKEINLENDEWLGEFDFFENSGWMYAVNNQFPGVGAAGWTLQNDQVMRWQYTIYGLGADLNANNKEFGGRSIVTTALKDNLTWRVAEINAMEASEKAQYQENYDKALAILQNMESTQEEVDTILAALGGTERQGVEVTAEMPEEAKDVETVINAIPLSIKLSDKQIIEEVRAAYEALSPTMQQWIWKDTLVLLENAEGKIAKLEQQVAQMIEQIAALPAAETLTLADEELLKATKNEFSTLSDEQKALVTNAEILMQLTTKLDVLKGLAESKPVEETKPVENTSVEAVMELINVLPKEATLKLTDEAKITAAKTAYDALSKEQQKQVTNYDKLADVLTKLNTLKVVDKVMKAIDDLPIVSSLKIKDEDELEDARKLYDALTKEQKALVTNFDELKDLESQMKKLKSSSTKSSGSSGGSGGSKATTTAKPATETPVQTTNTPAASNYKVEKTATSLNVTFTQAQMNELAASQNETVTINAGAAISVEIPKAVFTENLSKDAEFSVAVMKENDTLQVKLLEVLANGMKREITLPGNYVKVKFPLTLFTAAPTASLSPIAQDATGVILRVVEGEYKAVPHQIKNGEVSIYANSNDEYVYSTKAITFDDIAKLANKADIEFLASRYVVNGTSDTTFEPNKSITRAQFGAMIARALNLVPTEDTHYADTKGKWYEADIQALYEAGITNAPGDFNPGTTLSREHAAVFMYRVLEYIQKDSTPKATAAAYADQEKINASYAEAIATLNSLKIMQGKDGNVFDPKGHLTRAQMAKVLRKTLEAIEMM